MPLGVTLLRACPFRMTQREGQPLAILPGTAALLLTCGVSCHCPTLANMGHARVWGRALRLQSSAHHGQGGVRTVMFPLPVVVPLWHTVDDVVAAGSTHSPVPHTKIAVVRPVVSLFFQVASTVPG